jgi:hypothetical protein
MNVSRFEETDIVLDYLCLIATKSQLSSCLMELSEQNTLCASEFNHFFAIRAYFLDLGLF